MHSKVITELFVLGALLSSTNARQDPPGNGILSACHSESCDECPRTASVNSGYPNCIVYSSTGNLDGYESSSGNGYDVWWNSGDPNSGCKIIVRTPASTDLPACGYFLRDWDTGGCYYTAIQDSFMLQYCCGSGDCEAAEPTKRSIDEVHAAHLQGFTASTAIQLADFTEADSGSTDLGSAGSVQWRRRSSSAGSLKARAALSQEAARAANELARDRTASTIASRDETSLQARCDDSFDLASKYTKGGEQARVSPTQNCNVPGGCSIEISTTIETGYSVSFSVGINIGVLESSLSVSFSESQSRSISFTFNQEQGTTGYVTFIPTFDCYRGTYHSCSDGDADGDACNPRLLGSGTDAQQDGTYSFVYT